MKFYRKIRTVYFNFNTKIIRRINFGKTSKKFVKVQVSTICLNDRSKAQYQNNKKKNYPKEQKGKTKNVSVVERDFVVTDYQCDY